jgi:hypothetical protein
VTGTTAGPSLVIEISQTYGRLEVPEFNDLAEEMPTSPSEYTLLRAALRHRPTRLFCGVVAIWNERGIQLPALKGIKTNGRKLDPFASALRQC